tara:strand:+ start:2115 stop:2897 length:783 start_codon:yes stop_codon:yes gene_type:complete
MLSLKQSLGLNTIKNMASFPNKYSLDFDGVDDYVTFGDADVFTPNSSGADRGFTMSYWVNLSASGNQEFGSKRRFAGGGQRYEWRTQVDFQSKPVVTFYGNDNQNIYQQLILDTALSTSRWYHIAFTFDLADANTSIVGYLDGVKATHGSGATYSSVGTWSAVSNTAAPMDWGRIGNSYGNQLLDEISLFDDALSEAQVQAIYNSGTPTDLSGETYLLGYWRNGDTAGPSVFPTIEDYSSNSNDGTMTNMASGDIVTNVP